MKSAAFATLLLCSILAGRAATADALTISIAQLQALNAPNLFQIANQGFSQAGFQTSTRALATLIQVLQAITLPYLANQVVNLNGSLQTLATLVSSFNSTLTGVNITLEGELDLHEAQDTQNFQMINSKLSQLNNTSSQLINGLNNLTVKEANDTQVLSNRIDQLNNTIAPLSMLNQTIQNAINGTNLTQAIQNILNGSGPFNQTIQNAINQTIQNALNNSGLNQTIGQIQQQVSNITNYIANGSANLSNIIGNITQQVGNLSQEVANITNFIANGSANLTNLTNQFNNLSYYFDNSSAHLTNLLGNITYNLGDQLGKINNLNGSVNNLTNRLNQDEAAIASLNGSVNNLNNSLQNAVNDLKNYVDTNIIGNVSAIQAPNLTAIRSEIAGNASALQTQFLNAQTSLNATIQAQLGNLDNKISQSNSSLTTAIGNAINYLENMILSNSSAVNASIAQTALDASNALSAAVNNIDSQLNLLFLNDSITVYANNSQTAGLFTMFSVTQLIDPSGIPISISEYDYIIAFSSPHFDNPPLVALSLTYTGSGVPQGVSLVLSNLSSTAVTVRVITIDGSVLDTSGKLGFNLIAYGV